MRTIRNVLLLATILLLLSDVSCDSKTSQALKEKPTSSKAGSNVAKNKVEGACGQVLKLEKETFV